MIAPDPKPAELLARAQGLLDSGQLDEASQVLERVAAAEPTPEQQRKMQRAKRIAINKEKKRRR